MATFASHRRVSALEGKIGYIVPERLWVEANYVSLATFMIGVAVPALRVANCRLTAMESFPRVDVSSNRLVAT